MCNRRPTWWALILLLLILFDVSAQVTSGVIQGQISDPQGGVIPNAITTALNVATNVKSVAQSNETGFYLFPRLLPGTYRVSIEVPGFRRFVRENVVLSVDTIVRVDATMEIGQTTESVTVTGAPPLLKTDRTDVSSTIEARTANELPLVNRNITFLMNIIPGTVPKGRGEITTGDVNLDTNGVHSGRNYQAMDGIDNHEAISGAALMVASLESVGEVKITTNAYDAEYGQIGGAMTLLTTKSGTNRYHGSLFEYMRNNVTSARNPFSEATRDVAPLRMNQFGGTIGGPIKRDKLFFFVSYEGLRVRQGSSALTTVPRPEYRAGDFSEWAGQYPIYDPNTGDTQGKGRLPFPNSRIPADRVNPTARKILDLIPAPNVNVGSYFNNFSKGYSSSITHNQLIGRGDWRISDKSQLMVRYDYNPKNSFSPTAFGEPLQPFWRSIADANAMAFNYIRTISPNFLVEGRFGFTRVYNSGEPSDLDKKVSEEFGIPNVNTRAEMGGLMQLTVAGPVGGFTVGTNDRSWNHQTNFTYSGNFVWNRGSHTMKWGAEIRDGYFSDFRYAKGQYTFRETPTASADFAGSGIGLATFMLGRPGALDWRRQSFGDRMERQDRDGFYWQDQWRITRKLTMNYGLRYELYSPPWSPYRAGGTQYNLDLNVAKMMIANVGPVSKSANIKWDKNNFSPRLGFAYRFRDKMVARLGYGRTYTIGIWGESLGAFSNQWPTATFQNIAADNPYVGMPDLSLGPPPLAGQPELDPSGMMRQPNGEWVCGYREDNPINYIDAWNVSFQHEFAPNWSYEVAHVGNNSVHNWQNIDLNGAPPGPGPLSSRQPYAIRYGITSPIMERSANSKANYYSFQAKVEKRYDNGWSFGQAFTWGKAIDRSWGYVQQNWCRECSKSVADFDVSTVSRTWWVAELPFGPGRRFFTDAKGFTRHMVQGWQITGIASWRSGYAFTPVVGNTSRLNSYWYANPVWRPNRTSNGKLEDRSQNGWFDVSAFTIPADYTFGTGGRNILRGPGEFVPDIDLSKSFRFASPLGESTQLKFRASMYNAFNIANLGSPNASIDSPTAGQIFSISTAMRRMEFGLHLYF